MDLTTKADPVRTLTLISARRLRRARYRNPAHRRGWQYRYLLLYSRRWPHRAPTAAESVACYHRTRGVLGVYAQADVRAAAGYYDGFLHGPAGTGG